MKYLKSLFKSYCYLLYRAFIFYNDAEKIAVYKVSLFTGLLSAMTGLVFLMDASILSGVKLNRLYITPFSIFILVVSIILNNKVFEPDIWNKHVKEFDKLSEKEHQKRGCLIVLYLTAIPLNLYIAFQYVNISNPSS